MSLRLGVVASEPSFLEERRRKLSSNGDDVTSDYIDEFTNHEFNSVPMKKPVLVERRVVDIVTQEEFLKWLDTF
jgi:hypothetical protein